MYFYLPSNVKIVITKIWFLQLPRGIFYTLYFIAVLRTSCCKIPTFGDHKYFLNNLKSNSETMEIQLRTPEDELARVWLNNPKFITTVDRGDRLLMFFREEIPSQNPEIKRNRVKSSVSGTVVRVDGLVRKDLGKVKTKYWLLKVNGLTELHQFVKMILEVIWKQF